MSKPKRRRAPRSQQLTIFPRGGRRRGAGRKPKGPRAMVSHAARARLSRHEPVLVTSRLCAGLPRLRRSEELAALRSALAAGAERFGLRLVHFSIQENHLHFLVEVESEHS